MRDHVQCRTMMEAALGIPQEIWFCLWKLSGLHCTIKFIVNACIEGLLFLHKYVGMGWVIRNAHIGQKKNCKSLAIYY